MTTLGMTTLLSVDIGGSATPWMSVGFNTVEGAGVPVRNGALTFVGGLPGIRQIGVGGLSVASREIDGIPFRRGDPAVPIDHSNGAFELDHLVIMTDSLERTSESVVAELGLERRRTREIDEVRQAFHRFAPAIDGTAGCILEIVESASVDRAELFGVVFTVTDLDAVVATYDRETLGRPKLASQPGRYIATFRSGAGLGVPAALMSPEV
jgi:catechol 2,3-dioxygenase-like lactoylglutathione lyase family enzyme